MSVDNTGSYEVDDDDILYYATEAKCWSDESIPQDRTRVTVTKQEWEGTRVLSAQAESDGWSHGGLSGFFEALVELRDGRYATVQRDACESGGCASTTVTIGTLESSKDLLSAEMRAHVAESPEEKP